MGLFQVSLTPKQPCKKGVDTRGRVVQETGGSKGNTNCVHYAFALLRFRIGKNPSPEFAKARAAELAVSKYRKARTAIYQLDFRIAEPLGSAELAPAWTFGIPSLIPNDKAMFAGLILGLLSSVGVPSLTERLSVFFDKAVGFAMKLIISVIPVFIAGFAVKLIHDKMIESIVRDYALIFSLVALAQLSYVVCIYLVANGFDVARAVETQLVTYILARA